MSNALHKPTANKELISCVKIIAMMIAILSNAPSAFATTKGLSQIVTPDLQAEGDLSLSLQIQDKRIANPYELQAELGLTKWAEVAVFRGFQPDDWIFGTEIGLLTKEPFLLSAGFVNWSPHLNVDPQPLSKPATTPSITRSSSEPFMPDTKTKQSLAMPMTSMRDGECSSIGRAVLKTHRRSVSPATSHGISSSIQRSISVTTI